MISVVIPAYNAAATIDECLDALGRQTAAPGTYEVLVVDDGSSDDTPLRVGRHPGVRLLAQPHGGPAAARNLGVAHARGEIVLFTDADCAPAPDWIERLSAPLLSEPEAGARPLAGAKGTYRTRQRQLVARFAQVEYEEKYRHMAGLETIDFVDTYSAAYRRTIFLENGGFETCFPVASVEDQEFSFRLARRGYRMIFVPQAQVYHMGHPKSLAAYWKRKFKIGYWKVTVVRRHPGKLWSDSHTPQSLRPQIVLVVLLGACLLGMPFWHPLGWGAGLAALAFLATALPFSAQAWRSDRAVALVAPFLLMVRALALGVGFGAGLASG